MSEVKNMENVNKVTSIEELKSYNSGSIIRLPDFGEGQEFYARVRRPSLLRMVSENKIPNSLLNVAKELFDGGATRVTRNNVDQSLTQMLEVIEIICEASFIEPTYQEIKDAGIKLTDEQMLFIFGYSQVGVKQLENFRR